MKRRVKRGLTVYARVSDETKKPFIHSCDQALFQRLPQLENQNAKTAMRQTIRDLKNELSLARDPTSGCLLS